MKNKYIEDGLLRKTNEKKQKLTEKFTNNFEENIELIGILTQKETISMITM